VPVLPASMPSADAARHAVTGDSRDQGWVHAAPVGRLADLTPMRVLEGATASPSGPVVALEAWSAGGLAAERDEADSPRGAPRADDEDRGVDGGRPADVTAWLAAAARSAADALALAAALVTLAGLADPHGWLAVALARSVVGAARDVPLPPELVADAAAWGAGQLGLSLAPPALALALVAAVSLIHRASRPHCSAGRSPVGQRAQS